MERRLAGRWVSGLRVCATLAVFLCVRAVCAQYTAPYVILQGPLMTAGGTPAANATLTLAPSQVMFVAGTGVVVAEQQCSTDVNGNVVGLPNPLTGARVSAQPGTGMLTPGNYYVTFAWYDQFGGITLTSPEVAIQLLATGELQILPPVGSGPPSATGMKVYIGTAPGTETLQGSTSSTTAQYTQAAALATGAAPPISNGTACRVVANDAAWPTGTGYQPSLTDASGNTLINYTEMWQFTGPGSAYNLSSGLPYYHGQVIYPVPILTIPYNHNPQSISSPLSMGSPAVMYPIYNVLALGVGTALPGWGVDVEGTGLDADVNAAGGYLVNGNGGTPGKCLGSDGTAYDTPIACLTTLPTVYYQTMAENGTPQTQRPLLNFSTRFLLTDSSSPAETIADLNAPGYGEYVATYESNPGTSTNCAQYDGNGNLEPAPTVCGASGLTTGSNANGYWEKDALGWIREGSQSVSYSAETPVTFPVAFTNAASIMLSFSSNNASGDDIGYCTFVTGSITTTGFTIHLANQTPMNCGYLAVGY